LKGTQYLKNLFKSINDAEIKDNFEHSIEFDFGIQKIIELIKSQIKLNKKVIFIGNGGSSAIASHGTLDFWKNANIRAINFNDSSLLTCIGNDYGFLKTFEKPIEIFAEYGDVLIAISSSGQSENILFGVEKAKEIGCKVITLSGFNKDNLLREKGDFNIYIPSDQYGIVELSHQIIIHMISDIIIKLGLKA